MRAALAQDYCGKGFLGFMCSKRLDILDGAIARCSQRPPPSPPEPQRVHVCLCARLLRAPCRSGRVSDSKPPRAPGEATKCGWPLAGGNRWPGDGHPLAAAADGRRALNILKHLEHTIRDGHNRIG